MKTFKQLAAIGLFLLLTAMTMTSCNSSRRLGCPMKITATHQPAKPVS